MATWPASWFAQPIRVSTRHKASSSHRKTIFEFDRASSRGCQDYASLTREVIAQDSGNFVAYKLLGEIAMQKQDHEKAAERFGAAYKLKPDDPECKGRRDDSGSRLNRE